MHEHEAHKSLVISHEGVARPWTRAVFGRSDENSAGVFVAPRDSISKDEFRRCTNQSDSRQVDTSPGVIRLRAHQRHRMPDIRLHLPADGILQPIKLPINLH
ncbi:hypothetical protein [Salinibacterium sp. SWN1162]|uniref:hypothetical protein n=1 Tax=Salinibacterium sp. SWN1162 TaxID=2792053 RepID=UPI0018CDF0B2|nr:hypothetical protein [Salinibacterium sp. SWN1162]MBH0008611.1 hypothetical protein [Salinibacterium sp. SWN1162]